jgi:hypothetical protein
MGGIETPQMSYLLRDIERKIWMLQCLLHRDPLGRIES